MLFDSPVVVSAHGFSHLEHYLPSSSHCKRQAGSSKQAVGITCSPEFAGNLCLDKHYVYCSSQSEPHMRSIPAGADTLRSDAQGVVQQLKRMGTQVLLLSGDNQPAVDGIAHQAGIAGGSAWGGMRPEQKAAFVRQLREQGKVRAGGCAAIPGCMLWLLGAAEQAKTLLVSDESPSGLCCFHPALLVGGAVLSVQGLASCTGLNGPADPSRKLSRCPASTTVASVQLFTQYKCAASRWWPWWVTA